MATITETKTSFQTMEPKVLPYAPIFVLQTLSARLPECQFDANIDFEAIASTTVDRLTRLEARDFAPEPMWRDTFALTGSLRTFYSAQSIVKAWADTTTLRQATDFKTVAGSARPISLGGPVGWVDVEFDFRVTAAPAARCIGYLSLVKDGGEWRIWMLRTVLEQLDGCGDVDSLPSQRTSQTNGVAQPNGVVPEGKPGGETSVLDCVVVGGGLAGLSCGGRLQALGASYIILDKHSQIGDNWATRYDSAKLHTPREYNQLPFNRAFPGTCNDFLTKDELAQGYKTWAHEFGIDNHVWLQSSLERGTWDSAKGLWTLYVNRSGSVETLTARTVIMAIGPGGQTPTMPTFPGQADFKGTILHSVDYRSASQWKGKSGLVIGTANTAHDVAQDMVGAGLSSVTMVQRTRTHVLPWEYYAAIVNPSYTATSDIDAADRASQSMPNAVTRLMAQRGMYAQASQQPERFDALEQAGFKCERYGEILWHILERLGGHYIDVGCSKLIADGLIKMKSGPIITAFTPNGVAFSDGTEVPADVVVFCTGFVGSMNGDLERIFGKSIADEFGEFWGLDEEGEVKGAFKRSGHPGMWCIGGTIPGSRYFSRHIALQIKAQVMGQPLPIYTGTTH